jgi:hypothetical protein
MVKVPVALLLNSNAVVAVSVVASGNLNVCPPVPFNTQLNVEATVNVVVPAAAVTVVVL